LALVSPIVVVTAMPAYAADLSSCSRPDVDYVAESGTDVPVIVVHGYGGYLKNQFGGSDPNSIMGRLERIQGVRLVQQFQYSNYEIYRTANTDALAYTIDCAAQKSLQAGGRGKVVVIGYSEGAAMTHIAASVVTQNGQRAVANEIGFVITIADAWRLPVFAPWSNRPFPPTIVSRAIAGNVVKVQTNASNRVLASQDTRGDNLVATADALASGSTAAAGGGGSLKIDCQERYSSRFFFAWTKTANAPCEHGNLLNHGPVRSDVESSLTKYVDSLPPISSEVTALTVGPLTMRYGSEWASVRYGIRGPGGDSFANDTTNLFTCTNCTQEPPPQFPAFVQVTNMSWCSGTLLECSVGPDTPIVGTAPAVSIGGRTPDSSARYLESGLTNRDGLVWCFSDENVCVAYRASTGTTSLSPSQALQRLFSTATWS
jgi:hypothetical protein